MTSANFIILSKIMEIFWMIKFLKKGVTGLIWKVMGQKMKYKKNLYF